MLESIDRLVKTTPGQTVYPRELAVKDCWNHLAFLIRRLPDDQKRAINNAVKRLMYATVQYVPPAKAVGDATPVPAVQSVPPVHIDLHVDPGAIQVRNVLPADMSVNVTLPKRHQVIERDSNGELIGTREV